MWSIHHPNQKGEGLCQNLLLCIFFLKILIQGYKNSGRFQVCITLASRISFYFQVIVNHTILHKIIFILLFLEFFFVILTLQDNLYFILINLHKVKEVLENYLDLVFHNYFSLVL